ncbi:MAG: peptidyl-prolyl cis-trans isomerase [Robiginitomaculum sp.]|nr:peptidyl-prolyl cis-trans isomerase [Robiginitomaculum sp.]
MFTLTWQRPPSKDELQNLVQDHIKEEIYYREALALGLDENDTIVRRRMRQKLEFMQEDLSGAQEPKMDDLKAYFIANQDRYKTDRVLSFRQVLVSTKRVGTDALAVKTIQELQVGADPSQLTRSALLPISMKLETEKSVSNIFGDDFLGEIAKLRTGQWAGPIRSAFGTHIVFIQLDQKSTPLDFEAALPKLRIDYVQQRRDLSAEAYYQSLRKNYSIIIDNSQ